MIVGCWRKLTLDCSTLWRESIVYAGRAGMGARVNISPFVAEIHNN